MKDVHVIYEIDGKKVQERHTFIEGDAFLEQAKKEGRVFETEEEALAFINSI